MPQTESLNSRVYEFAEISRNKQFLLFLFSLGYAEPASPEGKPLFRSFPFIYCPAIFSASSVKYIQRSVFSSRAASS